jgi:hypothetical protein
MGALQSQNKTAEHFSPLSYYEILRALGAQWVLPPPPPLTAARGALGRWVHPHLTAERVVKASGLFHDNPACDPQKEQCIFLNQHANNLPEPSLIGTNAQKSFNKRPMNIYQKGTNDCIVLNASNEYILQQCAPTTGNKAVYDVSGGKIKVLANTSCMSSRDDSFGVNPSCQIPVNSNESWSFNDDATFRKRTPNSAGILANTQGYSNSKKPHHLCLDLQDNVNKSITLKNCSYTYKPTQKWELK